MKNNRITDIGLKYFF